MSRLQVAGRLGGAARPALRLRVPALVAPGALLLYTALAFVAFASAWRDPFRYGVGVPGDPEVYTWFLRWFPYATSHGLNPFFTDFADFPQGANLLWNTSMPLVAYLLWPVTAVSPVVAYDLMETLGLAVSAWCAFLLLRRCVGSPVAAGVGGLLYGFSPGMMAQSAGHPALTVAFLPPLVLLLLDEIVRVQRRRAALLAAGLALACVAEFLVSEEVLVVTGLVFVVLLVTAIGLWPREAPSRAGFAIRTLLLAGVLFAAGVAWPLWFQLTGPQHLAGTAHVPNVYVNDLLGFWVPSQVQWLAPGRALRISAGFSGNYSEWNSYLGVPLTLLLVFTVVRWWRNGWVRLAALAGAVIAILSLGITLHVGGVVHPWLPVFALGLLFLLLPRSAPARVLVVLTFALWLALWRLPLLDSLLPSRLMLLGYLLVGLLVAVFVDGLVGLGWPRVAAGAAALLVALAPLVPRLPYTSSEYRTPAFFAPGGAVSRVPPGSVALVAPVTTYADVDAMYWQAASGMRYRMPEGYLFIPESVHELFTPTSPTANALWDVQYGRARSPLGDEAARRAMRADLAAWGVRTVIVGPMPNREDTVALLTWVLGRPPEETGGVSVWWDVDV
ncbi:MAG TPA: hypothetical protein VOB72_26965 [Candidatus Dormibacteraeota bacterium]|nr:hypothetical protein [Candidatus Dormibacteraeota bacterium]